MESWQLFKAVCFRNSCLKEITEPTLICKSVFIFPSRSFFRVSRINKQAWAFPDISHHLLKVKEGRGGGSWGAGPLLTRDFWLSEQQGG